MSTSHYYALIMAGGRGTRFWPRSRRKHAKQVLKLFGDKSLIQQTVERLSALIPFERMWVITNTHLRPTIVRQLPQIPSRQIIAEPAQRNTAPCIGLGARILHSMDPEAVMGVFPSDHVILQPDQFLKTVEAAYETAATQRALVVLGIQPKWPETGYGYIEFPQGVQPGTLQPYPVLRFREKPDVETARQYLASGRFFWNAGMFFWRADVILEALRKYLPTTAQLIDQLPRFASRDFKRKLQELYPQADDISIDYAVMEKAAGVVGFAAGEIGWSDVGSWKAVYELLAKQPGENVLLGEALTLDAAGNYIDVPRRFTAVVGVSDLVIVDTPDALLICHKDQAQKVGDVVKILEKQGREDLL